MKKNFRRIAAILVAILAIGTLTACGNNAEDAISDETKNEVESNTNNTEGTVSDETTQDETKPNDSVEEIIIGKAITIVEDGCTYYVAATDTTLEAGTEIPAPSVGDKYETPDYKYTYGFERGGKKIDEWNVKVKDKTKENYGEILYSIAGNKLTNMYETFYECTNLIESPAIPSGIISLYNTYHKCEKMTIAPVIPDSVTDMSGTFSNCISLTEAPEIPNSVTRMHRTFCACKSLITAPVIPDSVDDMKETFLSCTSLVNAPVIPENVTNMEGTFDNCTSLTGTIEINANPYNYKYCFQTVNFTEQNLTLTGSSEKLDKLKETTTD